MDTEIISLTERINELEKENSILRHQQIEIISEINDRDADEACCNNSNIDLILMDMQMPEMNGYEATRQIRQFNTEVITIALRASALAGDREKAIKAGCNDYISKPVKKEELQKMVNRYFGN